MGYFTYFSYVPRYAYLLALQAKSRYFPATGQEIGKVANFGYFLPTSDVGLYMPTFGLVGQK